MAEENIFSFDTNPFMRGLKKVTQGMGALQKGASNMAKNVSRGVVNAAAKLGLLKLAFKGIQNAIKEMPEIGKTFEIAKGIIMKNLLYPLRKAIFPLLQKFLNWVRDNRAMFIKWGAALVDVFRFVAGGIQTVIDIGGKLANMFLDFVNKTFGMQINNFQELLNILIFKIAVVIEFLKALLEPALDLFGKISDIVSIALAGAFETLGGFIDGFVAGIGNISAPIDSILESVKKIVTELFKANKSGYSMKTLFETIGRIFGQIVNWVTKMVSKFLIGFAPAIKDIMTPINEIAIAFGSIFDDIFGSDKAMAGWEQMFENIGKLAGDSLVVAFRIIADTVKDVAELLKLTKEFFEFLGFKTVIDTGPVATIEEMRKDTWVEPYPELTKLQNRQKEEYWASPAGKKELERKTWTESQGFPYTPSMQAQMYQDVIITKRGEVVRVSPDDNIAAFKDDTNLFNSSGNNKSSNINIDFTGMQIVLQQGTQEEASRFGESLVASFRNQLALELETSGAQ